MKEVKEITESKEVSKVLDTPTVKDIPKSKSNLKLVLSLIALIIVPYCLFLSTALLKGVPLIPAMKYAVGFFVAFHILLTVMSVTLDFALNKSLGKHSDGEAFLNKIFNKLLVVFAIVVMFLVVTLAKNFTFIESNELLNVLVSTLIAAIYTGFSILGGLGLITFRRELRRRKIVEK